MHKRWSDRGWDEYLEWQDTDRKTVKKINDLIKDIERNGVSKGQGFPERLKYIDGWSRRIDKENRLVYDIDENGCLIIASCKGHYDD